MTKLSHLHFVSNIQYKKRVIQLGEKPKSVFNVGALGVENIKNSKLLTKKELEKSLGIKFSERNILITYHPVTLSENNKENEFYELMEAINNFPKIKFIFTYPNIDYGNSSIIQRLKNECSVSSNKTLIKSLGQEKNIFLV